MDRSPIARRSFLKGAAALPAVSAASQAASAAEPASFAQTGRNAWPRSIEDRLRDTVSVKDFGAAGDGVADDSRAIQAAILFGQINNRAIIVPPGTYVLTETLTVSGPGHPIALTGDADAPMQQGSDGPAVILRWRGGRQPMIRCTISGSSFVGVALQNFGAATDAFHLEAGQHHLFKRLSFLVPAQPGASRFSRSCIYSERGSLGYARLETIWFGGAAPKFAFMDGSGHREGGTPFEVCGRCIFESNAASGPVVVFYLKAQDYDGFSVRGCTFNQQENSELTVLDTRDSPRPVALTAFVFTANEIDIVSAARADRMLRAVNVRNIRMDDNIVQGGSVQHICDLVNSRVTSFRNNYAISVAGTFFNADDRSRVNAGPNEFVKESTAGYVNLAAMTGVIPVMRDASGVARIMLDLGEPGGVTVFRLTARSDDPSLVIVASETESIRSVRTPGQVFVLEIRNESRGRLSNLRPTGPWKLQGQAPPSPMPGHSIALTCVWDGAAIREIGRSGDIPN